MTIKAPPSKDPRYCTDDSLLNDCRRLVSQAALSAVCKDPMAAASSSIVNRKLFCTKVKQDMSEIGFEVIDVIVSTNGMVAVSVMDNGVKRTISLTSDDLRAEIPDFGPNFKRSLMEISGSQKTSYYQKG